MQELIERIGSFFRKNYVAFLKYLKSVRSEMKRVTWPTKKELYTSTLMVTAVLFVVSIFVYFVDNIFTFLFLHVLYKMH
ncbi:MAG: preprotein translocase subunit SecE [bacterium ADurb.Bin363]|nr:MAG: preprotein translocase subunit SecE [bacterium ADurb.Bin363]